MYKKPKKYLPYVSCAREQANSKQRLARSLARSLSFSLPVQVCHSLSCPSGGRSRNGRRRSEAESTGRCVPTPPSFTHPDGTIRRFIRSFSSLPPQSSSSSSSSRSSSPFLLFFRPFHSRRFRRRQSVSAALLSLS